MEEVEDMEPEQNSVNLLRNIPDGIEKSLSAEQVIKILNDTHEHWKTEPENEDLIYHLTERFGETKDGSSLCKKYKDNSMTTQDLYWVYHREMFKRVRIETLLRQKHLIENGGDPYSSVDDFIGDEFATKIGELQDCIHRAYQCILSNIEMRKIYDKTIDRGCPPLIDPFGYIPYQLSKLSDFQRLIVFILRKLMSYGYRRYQGKIYEQIMSPCDAANNYVRYPTKAWKYKSEIKNFIEEECRKEVHFNHWQSILTSNNLQSAEKYLHSCVDHEFSELKPNRLWHSFNNGIYSIEHSSFYKFNEVPSYIVSCKYHDQSFDEKIIGLSWEDVPTPHIDSIIKHQFSTDNKDIANKEELQKVLLWIYGMIGRLLYNVNEKDNWQIMPFLIGKGKTGKSSLLKIISKFYNEEDVAVLSNNAQKGFGLETIFNKYIWMCYETKNDFTLDQGQLQSMISGENVSIQRKFKEAISLEWNTPGILAGNEAPSWTDNSGSISRRFLLMYFDKTVKSNEVDPGLEMKAKSQIGNTIHKMTLAYHKLISLYGANDVWKEGVLPSYFHISKKRLQKVTHVLVNFIESENKLTCKQGVCMPFSRFKELFRSFCDASGIKKFTWNEGKFETIFEEYSITRKKVDKKMIEDDRRFIYNNVLAIPGDEWLFGITEVCEIFENEIASDAPPPQMEKEVEVQTEIVEEEDIVQKQVEDARNKFNKNKRRKTDE